MALFLRSGLCVTGSYEMGLEKKELMVAGPSDVLVCKKERKGSQVVLSEQISSERWSPKGHSHLSIHAQSSICVPRAMSWWEKNSKPNMVEIKSAQDLVDSLLNAGDNLVIVDFYSPGCGRCKALHPKICQFAELYPNAIFLKVNYEEHRSMCQPAHSCVVALLSILSRVLKDECRASVVPMQQHGTERCSLGQEKGLEESEMLSSETNFSYPLRSPVAGDLSLAGRIASSFYAEVDGRTDLAMASVH